MVRSSARDRISRTRASLRHDRESVNGFLRAAFVGMLFALAARAVSVTAIVLLRRARITVRRTIIVGSGPLALDLATILARYPRYGLSVVGCVDRTPPKPSSEHVDLPWLGEFEAIEQVVARHQPDVLLIADPEEELRLYDLARNPACGNIELIVVPRLHQFYTQEGLPDHIGAIPVTRARIVRMSGLAWRAKRAIDVTASLICLTGLSPVLLLCALAVRIEGGPGVLFRQNRVGRNGRSFELIKFRSIKPVDGSQSATEWKLSGDRRPGPVGRILRMTSLDELPQLWNILKGDMTLVGPRPERPHFVQEFGARHPHYMDRHRAPAGLTGLAQVSGLRGDTPIDDRARFDNYYIENWSLWLDFKIIVRTIVEVLTVRGG